MKLRGLVVVGCAALLLVAGCSSDKNSSSATTTSVAAKVTTTTTPAAAKTLHVLVTNDDGVSAPGIDALVQGLRGVQGVDVTVVAPATNQSGTGGKTTGGPLTVTDAKTASGYPAKAVAGYPADTLIWAVQQRNISPRPDLVMSGINFGQNVGSATNLSGTFGAAKEAATLGIPAVAVSQGLPNGGAQADFPTGVKYALDWLSSHRSGLAAAANPSGTATMWNLNVPTCGTTGTARGVVDVPINQGSVNPIQPSNCASTETKPADDVAALAAGFVPLTEIKSS
jgi:5'-nucleotidase